MKQIPLDAKVFCSDGRAGTSSHIIYDPTSKKVTHFVVSGDETVMTKLVLVPIDLVAEAGHDSISLNCTKEALAKLEPFVERRYVEGPGSEGGYPADSVYLAPYVSPLDLTYVPVEVERIPVGELALHRGAVVEAKDGFVGQLGELLLDPESGAITHLVLQEGHAWGKKEVAVPVSAVEQALEDTIVLKLDKAALEQLPAIPIKRDYGPPEEKWAVELLAKLFDNEEAAGKALKDVKKMSGQDGASFKVRDAAILIKDAQGKMKITETGDMDAGQGRLFGAVVGGLIGLLAGPVGVVLGALAGAGTGAFTAKHFDLGFADEFLKSLERHLEPGSSELLLLVEYAEDDEVFRSLATSEGTMLRQALTDDIVEQLLAADAAEAGEAEEID